jgi:type II secretory pathway component PulM
MNTATSTIGVRDNRILAATGFILFLAGMFVPLLCIWFRIPDALLYASGFAEVLALIFGITAWPQKLAQVTAFGAGLLCLLAIIYLVLCFRAEVRVRQEMQIKMEQRH